METTQQQQAPPMTPEPQSEHKWLQQLVGEWTYEASAVGSGPPCAADATMEPGADAEKLSGSETVRSVGDIWIIGEGSGQMPDGSPATTILTLGYDPQTKRFVGTWIGSMMTQLWVYDGELDATGRVLTLSSEGPDFSGSGGTAKYRDVVELKSPDHRVLSSHVLGPDGNWQEFMRSNYHRTK